MKKFIMIMVILLFSITLSAAILDDADLTITASIAGVHEIEVFSTAPEGVGAFGAVGGTGVVAGDLELGEIDQSDEDKAVSESYVLAVRTNQRSTTSITIVVPDLTGINFADNYIQYSLESTTSMGTITSPGTSTVDATSATISVAGGLGLRVLTFPFTVTIADAAFRAANPDSYTATIAFLYTSP